MQDRDTARTRRTLDPKLDIVFWMLFGAEQNRDLLISLLNAVLQPAVPVEAVELLPTQPERFAVGDKNISLDVRVRLQNGEHVDVEMQSQRRPALRARCLDYWARLYTGQLQRGDPYTALRRCVVVLITDFVELSTPRFHSLLQVLERHEGQLLTSHLELHLVELPKLPSALDRNDEPNLTLWGKFLAARVDEELEELAMQDPVLKQAKSALDRLSADDIARLQAEHREMALLTYEAGMAALREEAEQKGFASALLRQLTIKFGPQPANLTERLTVATQPELFRWSERVLTAATLDDVFSSHASSSVLKQAKSALDRLSADDIARLQAEHREMALLTYEAGIAAAREEAEQKGFAAGSAQGFAQILLRQLAIKFGPQPASITEKLTAATQPELFRWSERVLSADTLEDVFAA